MNPAAFFNDKFWQAAIAIICLVLIVGCRRQVIYVSNDMLEHVDLSSMSIVDVTYSSNRQFILKEEGEYNDCLCRYLVSRNDGGEAVFMIDSIYKNVDVVNWREFLFVNLSYQRNPFCFPDYSEYDGLRVYNVNTGEVVYSSRTSHVLLGYDSSAMLFSTDECFGAISGYPCNYCYYMASGAVVQSEQYSCSDSMGHKLIPIAFANDVKLEYVYPYRPNIDYFDSVLFLSNRNYKNYRLSGDWVYLCSNIENVVLVSSKSQSIICVDHSNIDTIEIAGLMDLDARAENVSILEGEIIDKSLYVILAIYHEREVSERFIVEVDMNDRLLLSVRRLEYQ